VSLAMSDEHVRIVQAALVDDVDLQPAGQARQARA